MGQFDRILDWAAGKVQKATGEAERRELVEKIKMVAQNFKNRVEEKIGRLNRMIEKFNEKVGILNTERQGIVKSNVDTLFNFLLKFGNVKEVGQYRLESERDLQAIPERKFASIDAYISTIDWSRLDVELDTFFLTPIGMRIKTRNQNTSMNEQIARLQLEAESTLKQLEMQVSTTDLECRVCEEYTKVVRFISGFIKERILPELSVVEAFFQALSIGNSVVAGQDLSKTNFRCDLAALSDSPYEKHYLFVKNAFAFYVFSCKIYNTPILTRLLNHEVDDSDNDALMMYQRQLLALGKEVDANAIVFTAEREVD